MVVDAISSAPESASERSVFRAKGPTMEGTAPGKGGGAHLLAARGAPCRLSLVHGGSKPAAAVFLTGQAKLWS